MKALVNAFAVAACVMVVASAAMGECHWKQYTFDVDPSIQMCMEGTSVHYFFWLDEPVLTPEGGFVTVKFTVTGYHVGSLIQSSLAGPIGVGVTNCYPFVRLNWHYTSSVGPQQSICTLCNGSEPRFDLLLNVPYCANLKRVGATVEFYLYDMRSGSLVFTDVQPCDWLTFDRFHLCYDYYGGGYCVWDPANEEIDCRADRSDSFIEYSIQSITVCAMEPTAIEGASWGAVKALYR